MQVNKRKLLPTRQSNRHRLKQLKLQTKQYKKLKEDAKNGIKDSVNKKIDDTFEKF